MIVISEESAASIFRVNYILIMEAAGFFEMLIILTRLQCFTFQKTIVLFTAVRTANLT
jgi:hypothetical protein